MSSFSDVAVGNTICIPKAPHVTHGGRYFLISRVTDLTINGTLSNGKCHDIPYIELERAFFHQAMTRAERARSVLKQAPQDALLKPLA